MRPLADLHVHSVASRGAYSGEHSSATRLELAASAAAKGLELIAVTDHGPACPGAASAEKLAATLGEPIKLEGVIVLAGVEADPVPDSPNGLDVPDELLARLDFVTVAFHPSTGWERDALGITEALVEIMANPLVDMIAHPGNAWYPVDIETVVQAAVRHDVIVELNAHTFRPGSVRSDSVDRERAFAAAALSAGALVAVDSDAHHADDVGDTSYAAEVIAELGLTADRLVNCDASRVLSVLRAKRRRPRLEGLAFEEAS